MFQNSTHIDSDQPSKTQEFPQGQEESKNTEQKIIAQSIQTGDQTPRFVNCVSHDVYNGNLKEYEWDQEKIFVHESLRDDLLMLQNVFEGKIISPLVYPLVFDHKSPQKEIFLRSIQFYKEVQVKNSLYHNLSADDKGYFLIGVRDLFIAACRDILTQDEKNILTDIGNLIDPKDNNRVYKTINNIDIAPYPTAVHKMVRFIEEEPEEEINILDECFVRNELGLLIGFVDPRDLSFHNFENIMNLDSLFKVDEDFPITNFQKEGDHEVYTFDLEDKNNTLLSLDKYGLYTQPLNKLSRGGERFIFASRILGNNITSALQKHVSDGSIINDDFQFVNYVFRYNKFKPGDQKFTSHFDTPYHDATLQIYSKYTLLLYLTSGTADPVLNIDNGKLKIENLAVNNGCVKGVIFDQRYEHEGKSFVDTEKIFLRSELIYCYPEGFSFNADISRKFNIACYMTKQSVFNPELEKYASDCFHQAAQARLDLSKAKLTEDVLIYKNYDGISFITNGYDYWFLKNVCLKSAAIITLLDYFGCKSVGFDAKDYAYGFLCSRSQAVDQAVSKNLEEIQDVKDVFKYLKKCAETNLGAVQGQSEEEKDDKEVEKNDLIEKLSCNENNLLKYLYLNMESEIKKINSDSVASIRKELNWGECKSCKYEHPNEGEVRNQLQNSFYKMRNDLKNNKIDYTFLIFNKEIILREYNIEISEDSITFDVEIPSVNFAACQHAAFGYWDRGTSFKEELMNVTGYANIPPILYKVHDEGYHLKIELFNNGFVREDSWHYKKLSMKE